jgi:hypothetical protein
MRMRATRRRRTLVSQRHRTFVTHLTVAALAIVSACASGGGGSIPSARTEEERVNLDAPGGGSINLRLTHDASASEDVVTLASGPAWAALMRAYTSLGIPITASEPSKRLLGSGFVRAHRKFGGQSLSQSLDCGSSITGDNADMYEVTLRLVSEIEPAGDNSIVRTQIAATATAVGSSNSALHCTSKRTLEKKIARLVAGGGA